MESPQPLLDFLAAGRPPVFIGFGSMPVKHPHRINDIILTAAQRTGQRIILHSGWGGVGSLSLPESVFKIDDVPYGWLFPRMSMIFHHGGSGTTAYALRSGIPSCVIPFVFDQFYWGKRISQLGVGPPPIPFTKLTVSNLQRAIEAGTQSPEIQQRAAALGQRIAAEDGVSTAIHLISEYALKAKT